MNTDITQTPAFKSWFNGSKVVDSEGKPLKMYHSTKANFDVFDTEMAELGSHFGTLAQASDRGSDRYNTNGTNIMPVYLSIKNPIRLVDTGNFQAILFVRNLLMRGIINEYEWEKARNGRKPTQLNSSEMAFIKKSIISKGYDGAVYLNRNEGLGVSDEEFEELRAETGPDTKFKQRVPSAQDSWIAFYPNQIKSAIGNKGTFDPNKDRITAGLKVAFDAPDPFSGFFD